MEAKRGEKNGTFGEGNDVVVLVAEATEAVEETLADNVSGSVFAPPLWVTAGNDTSLRPTHALRLCVEESRPVLAAVAVAVATARTMGRGAHPSLVLTSSPFRTVRRRRRTTTTTRRRKKKKKKEWKKEHMREMVGQLCCNI